MAEPGQAAAQVAQRDAAHDLSPASAIQSPSRSPGQPGAAKLGELHGHVAGERRATARTPARTHRRYPDELVHVA